MPGLVTLVSAISADVVAARATSGLPALTDGKILIGKQHVFEASSPPRVVFVPMSSKFSPRSVAGRGAQMSAIERQSELAQRAIGTDTVHFEVHVWGQAAVADPDNDWDATQTLYQQIYASTYLTCVGCCVFTNGTWTDSTSAGTSLMNAGREFVFGIEIATPVLDTILPDANLPIAPAGTVPVTSTILVTSTGSSVGCTQP